MSVSQAEIQLLSGLLVNSDPNHLFLKLNPRKMECFANSATIRFPIDHTSGQWDVFSNSKLSLSSSHLKCRVSAMFRGNILQMTKQKGLWKSLCFYSVIPLSHSPCTKEKLNLQEGWSGNILSLISDFTRCSSCLLAGDTFFTNI